MRLAPLKVFHDLLLGEKDVYQIDKDLESMVAELKRELPAFWGRRVAKTQGLVLPADAPLKELAAVMAAPAKWGLSPPDFYALAYVPISVAAGAWLEGVYASHRHSVGAPPYENVAVLGAIAAMVMSILEDVGVSNTEVVDVSAVGVDLVSPADLFSLVSDFHTKAGSLSTTASISIRCWKKT